MEEIWKDIPGYEGLYKISNYGRVYSNFTGKIRKDVQSGIGYRAIQLSDSNRKKHRHYIHRLVAIAFLGEPPSEDYIINHKDLDKTNNVVTNLEWCTVAENNRHAYLNGRVDFRRPMRCDNTSGLKGVSKHSGGYEVTFCGEYIGWYKSKSEAAFVRYCVEQEALKNGIDKNLINGH